MKKNIKYTLNSTVVLAGIVAAIIFFNVIVGVLAQKVPLSVDLTKNKLFSLTDETKGVLSSLTDDVMVYYFVSPGSENSYVVETLDRYKTTSSHIKVEKRDPNSDPIFAKTFTDKGIAIGQNTLIVEKGSRLRSIAASDLYSTESNQSGQTYTAGFKLEQLLTRAISYVTSTKDINVYFTTGHNEPDSSAIAEAMEGENITTTFIDLKTTDIPENADALYILSPAVDFSAEEISKVEDYLAGGGSLNIALSSIKGTLPLLEQYMTEYWGITFCHDLVMEMDETKTFDNKFAFLPVLSEHSITQEIMKGSKGLMWYGARSLDIKEVSGVTAEIPVKTSETSVSFNSNDGAKAKSGVMNLAAALTRGKAKVFVTGAYQIYDKTFISAENLANSDFLYGVMRYLHGDESEALSISPKNLVTYQMVISDALATVYIFVFSVLPAVLILIAGFVTWRKRRHL